MCLAANPFIRTRTEESTMPMASRSVAPIARAPEPSAHEKAREIQPKHLPHNVKVSYALRRVPERRLSGVVPLPDAPRPGDVALARIQSVGKNENLELTAGRRCSLYDGDLAAVV